MRISVIMPVCLEAYYTNNNNNAEKKFIRSVGSFVDQEFKDCELIIVADGSKLAEQIYLQNFADIPNIKFKYIEKQVPFGGRVRQTGIEIAQGEIICYLDHDDLFGKKHLSLINYHFNTDEFDWVYYNDYLIINTYFNVLERNISPVPCQIGTSCIAHKKSVGVVWSDGYEHDWALIETYLHKKARGMKIPTPQYYVCHIPNVYDF
jgi:glycosyltransferase involved in cell wall biosynthesis